MKINIRQLWGGERPELEAIQREVLPLRMEVLSLEQLARYAKSLAERHELGPAPKFDPLLPRLADNEARLTAAYERLSAAVFAKERISPAGEWLLDNFHLIEEQIRLARRHLPEDYSRELPRLAVGPDAGLPRVYAIALEVIEHVDGRIDKENITTFVAAYQQVAQLKLGEFWAIPIMLRLALIENLRRVASRVLIAMDDRNAANYWADAMLKIAESDPKRVLLGAADMARSEPSMSNAFVAEFVRRLRGQSTALDIPLAWVEQQLVERGGSTLQTVQLEGQQQAANQVSVGASIGSLRFLASMDWRDFVEELSEVERELRKDPAHVYPEMDFATRDQYRHVVERLAKRHALPEAEVARRALAMASEGGPDPRLSHLGYYLIGDGFPRFDSALAVQSGQRSARPFTPRLRLALYLGSIALLSLILAGLVTAEAGDFARSTWVLLPIFALALLPGSQVAVALVNWVTTFVVGPKLMPRLDFSKGIPPENRTLVAVPCMLGTPLHLERLLDALEIRYLANRDENLRFGLVTDLGDAAEERLPGDETAISLAVRGIQALNEKYKRGSIFYLFHRNREWNAQEKLWMGFERKRGKLEALNAFLRGKPSPSRPQDPPFSIVVGDVAALSGVKYVITLDSDTQLPRDAARKLVATMAHPLNRPVFDPEKRIVIEGHGILQPRVAVSLPGSRRSLFVRLYVGDAGIDPYTRAVSDAYQDLFGEGSFVGKGIYDIDAFSAALADRLPENRILSHDLLEGSYARSGLVSDVQLYEDHPYHYVEEARRRHRWIRGDWQIAAWLLPRVPSQGGGNARNPLNALSKWKIFDNLRRSLVPLSSFALLALGWAGLSNAWTLMAAIVGMILLPPVLTSLAEAMRKAHELPLWHHLGLTWNAVLRNLAQAAMALVFLAHEACLNLDAILRAGTRMLVTRKKLLEWRSVKDPRDIGRDGAMKFYGLMASAPAAALALGACIAVCAPQALLPASSFLSLWFLSPAFAAALSRLLPPKEPRLRADETLYLRRLARKTWRFFETFVGPEDHWLPPDNFQEYPDNIIAHRTSPTNIGLYLLSKLAAYDFGYLSATSLVERTLLTFASLDSLERFRGHFYNWYDTTSLRPLNPQYVSTVDSGNLAGMLFTLRQGLKELPDAPIIAANLARGFQDTLAALKEPMQRFANLLSGEQLAKLSALENALLTPPRDLGAVVALGNRVRELVSALAPAVEQAADPDWHWWLRTLDRQCREGIWDTLNNLAPWALVTALREEDWELPREPLLAPRVAELRALLSLANPIPSAREVARMGPMLLAHADALLAATGPETAPWLVSLRKAIERACAHAGDHMRIVDALAAQCEDLAAFEYDFLYDKSRNLLAIGYNVSEHRRDASFYDLLASEARLCSFVAIAQGYLPQEHWFALGRLLTTSGGEPTLLSWSGSMFEYLMPMLVMPTFENTLLDKTYKTCVNRQIEYGKQLGVPWGISESGYNATDVHLNYQYRAFGVPGLGFKRGLVDDLVIAPYASVMALMVAPTEVCKNLAWMKALGFEGRYGFYEAIDYTPLRLSPDQSFAVLKSFMAHHQGMSFLALAYHLLDKKMPQRFQADAQFQAIELLLHERVPKANSFYPNAPELSVPQRAGGDRDGLLRVISTPDTYRPEAHLLSNGRYSVMVTNSGGGFSRWRDLALTRWREDPTCDNWGSFCYVREVGNASLWSAAYQPTLASPKHYEAIFPQARAEFRRRDLDFEMHTEITVSPEDDIELRRYSITNLSAERKVIELTSYAEVVLAPQAADVAHPAFSNLFLQTEIIRDKQGILCTRRPRSEAERQRSPTMLHLVTVHGTVRGPVSYETDRLRFIGRGRNLAGPAAMEAEFLSDSDGSVLDPIVAIRCRVEIGPEETVNVHFVTGVGESREAALELMEKYHDRHISERVLELAWTHRQVVLRQLNVSESDAQLYGRLASSVLYANPARRPSRSILVKNRRGQSGLWGYGISGDLPIVLLRASDPDKTNLLRQMIQAHSYWRMMGLAVDLVIWNEDESGYRQILQERILSLIGASGDPGLLDKPGGIFIRRAEQMSEEDRILLQTVARAVITDSGGTLLEQIERRGRVSLIPPPFQPTRARELPVEGASQATVGPLQFENGWGGFSSDGREYVIRTGPGNVTPAPWVNVLANQFFGTVVSESGGAYTWCENAHEFRLTPWNNDGVTDRCGEATFIRDEETGEYWSPTPLPARAPAPYVTRHGFGYSSFEVAHAGVSSLMTTFVAIDAPVKFALIKLRNDSDRPRTLSLTGYCEWVLGELRASSLMHVVTEVDPASAAVLARNPFHSEFGGRIAFFDVSQTVRTVTGDRTAFIGRNGLLAEPAAMRGAKLSGKVGAALDACAAIQTPIELAEGEEREIVFVLGVGRDLEDVRTLLRRFRGVPAAQNALAEVKLHWRRTLGAVQVKTPDPAVNVLANGWLLYQVLACRVWARSGFYQSGGAFGFRDQLQDAMALLHSEPQLLRAHLLRCAARQFREGDVQHWWHPPSGRGVRTHFSDDYLWLPLAASRYVLAVGDRGVLDERVPFIEGRQVKPDEEGYSDLPARSDESGSLYEHCVRALRRGMRYGQHGLPLMGCGDWNDGMNLVGEHGRGESVWLGFFLFDVLGQFAEVAKLYGDAQFAETCAAHREMLREAIETNAWDGAWYRRAYFDDGRPLGSARNEECRIDSLPQSWSVLSRAGDPERARQAMEAVSATLVDRENRLVKLFDPPFDTSDMNPGYIKGYVPGVRENGGQYTHAAIWTAMAFAVQGDHARAWELLGLINPLNHGSDAAAAAVYKVEPYVMAADVYAVAPHVGRGGWTWYTGAAGWMYRLILESLLGLRLDVDRLHFSPCIPPEWKGFELSYRYRETTYSIRVKSGGNASGGAVRVTVDGQVQASGALQLVDDRVEHQVEIAWT